MLNRQDISVTLSVSHIFNDVCPRDVVSYAAGVVPYVAGLVLHDAAPILQQHSYHYGGDSFQCNPNHNYDDAHNLHNLADSRDGVKRPCNLNHCIPFH